MLASQRKRERDGKETWQVSLVLVKLETNSNSSAHTHLFVLPVASLDDGRSHVLLLL